MKSLLGVFMISNAALFFLGALLHMGVVIGPFHQQRILPAIIVEIVCGFSLACGVITLFKKRRSTLRVAVITNVIALFGVLLGVLPRVLRRQTWPVIALDHRIMLLLIGVSLLLLSFGRLGLPRAGATENHTR
jgi:hypothetical protein